MISWHSYILSQLSFGSKSIYFDFDCVNVAIPYLLILFSVFHKPDITYILIHYPSFEARSIKLTVLAMKIASVSCQ